jgi:hypothetical protein
LTQRNVGLRDKLTNRWLATFTPFCHSPITEPSRSNFENAPRENHMISTRLLYSARQKSRPAHAQGISADAHVISYPANPFQFKLGRLGLWWALGCALIWAALMLTTLPAAAQQRQLFVPMAGTGAVGAVGEEPAQCALNEQEQVIAQLMVSDPDQQRENPVCDPTLSQVARARARDMALRGYFSHTNPDGNGPNVLVRQAGYALPDWYSTAQDGNNIESIGGGYPTPNEVWQGWMDSEFHRIHILGTDPFYGEQDAYGIGYYSDENSPMKHYWVILSAPVAE